MEGMPPLKNRLANIEIVSFVFMISTPKILIT